MKRRSLKLLHLNKNSVSNLNLVGGASPLPPIPRSHVRTGCMTYPPSCHPCRE
ncbi:hypothetical protein [uncultured Kordia sp.]|uniref:hypothetical protein n=1 Tax=uncultured Kordia sp. TaxID=507699 RepID=UPI00262272B3|nr:hypothetical protein [uncultured Kordia sp.]